MTALTDWRHRPGRALVLGAARAGTIDEPAWPRSANPVPWKRPILRKQRPSVPSAIEARILARLLKKARRAPDRQPRDTRCAVRAAPAVSPAPRHGSGPENWQFGDKPLGLLQSHQRRRSPDRAQFAAYPRLSNGRLGGSHPARPAPFVQEPHRMTRSASRRGGADSGSQAQHQRREALHDTSVGVAAPAP